METKILVETPDFLKVQSEKIPEDGNKNFSRNIGNFLLKAVVRKLTNRWHEHSLFHYVVL